MTWWHHPAVLFFLAAVAALTLALAGRLLVLILEHLGVCSDERRRP